jgi:hypothetical protein
VLASAVTGAGVAATAPATQAAIVTALGGAVVLIGPLAGLCDALRRLAIVDADFAALARAAHDLVGTAGNFGARELQSLAARIERASREGASAEALALAAGVGETAWHGRRRCRAGSPRERPEVKKMPAGLNPAGRTIV